MKEIKEVKEIVKELENLINNYGYEAYRKATFVMDLGVEEDLDNEKVLKKLEKMYAFYMENDYFTSPLDTNLLDKFYEDENDEESGEEESNAKINM